MDDAGIDKIERLPMLSGAKDGYRWRAEKCIAQFFFLLSFTYNHAYQKLLRQSIVNEGVSKFVAAGAIPRSGCAGLYETSTDDINFEQQIEYLK